MKPTWMLAGTAVLGIALGIGIGRSMAPDSADAGNTGAEARENSPRFKARERGLPQRPEAAGGDGMLSGILRGRTVEQLTVEDVRRFFEVDMDPPRDSDPVADARRAYQRQLLLSKLPADMLAELTATMLEAPDGNRNSTAVLYAWARKDWHAALAWADGSPERARWTSAVIGSLAATDLGAAEDLLKKRMLDGDASVNFGGAYPVAMAKARQGTKAFLDFIDQLPSEQQGNMISMAGRELPKEELVLFLTELGKRKDTANWGWGQGNVFTELLRVDPSAANAYLATVEPGPERTRLESNVLSHLAMSGKADDFGAMMKKSFERVEVAKQKQHVLELMGNLSSQIGRNPELMEKFVQAIPPDVRLTAADMGEGGSLLWGEAAGLISRARILSDPAEQAKYLAATLDRSTKQLQSSKSRRINEMDLIILEKRVVSLKLSGAAKEQVDASFSAFREAVRSEKAPSE